MKAGRMLLGAGALLLALTAAVHALGSAMVSSWLEGERGLVLRMLWFVPSIDWIVVALVWAYAAFRPDARLAWLVWLTAIIPFSIAIMLISSAGFGFFGIWMLLGAVALASLGAVRIR
jgi:hypothetical protein